MESPRRCGNMVSVHVGIWLASGSLLLFQFLPRLQEPLLPPRSVPELPPWPGDPVPGIPPEPLPSLKSKDLSLPSITGVKGSLPVPVAPALVPPCNGTGCPRQHLSGQCFLVQLNMPGPKLSNSTGGQPRCRTPGSNITFQTQGNMPTCMEILAVDKEGMPFDLGPSQWASFRVTLSSLQVKLAADVTYDPSTSTHHACFTPLLPGQHALEVKLAFMNAYQLLNGYSVGYGRGYRNLAQVLEVPVLVYNESLTLRHELPACTLDLLRRSNNEGSWVGHSWSPNVCSAKGMTQEDVYKLFHGKRIAFIGDSEMRYTFNVLRDFLSFNTMEEYFAARLPAPRLYDPLEIPKDKGVNHHSSQPTNPSTGKAYITRGKRQDCNLTYYGTFINGFCFYSTRALSLNRSSTYNINITYLTALGPLYPVAYDWMAYPSITTGATVPDQQGPYDLAFVASGLWDMCEFTGPDDMAQLYQRSFLPKVRSLVRSADSLVFFGMWAAYEARKPPRVRHCSNNVRQEAFEDAQLRVLGEEGYRNVIGTRLMTLARPDLSLDGTHYSWPVTLAMMNLAVGALKQ